MKRKLKQLKKVSVFLFAVLFMVSCTDDLNITPNDDDTLLTDDAFADEAAYRQLLAGVYANLTLTGTNGPGSSNIAGIDAGTSQFGRVLLYMQTLSADQMIWSYENDPGTREIQRNIWTAQNPLILGMFSRTHLTIAFANNFLRETTDEKLDSRGVSQSTRDEIVAFRAEARLLRAMSYYYMMDLFGKANFGTEADPINAVLPVANRAELFQFIEDELIAINSDLIDANQNEYGRADKGVAAMILAKLYLNAEVYIGQNRYADCITQCQTLLNSGYSLATSYLENFMADNNTNSATSEIIFPLVTDGNTTQNFGPTTVAINGSVGSLEVNGAEVGVTPGGWGGALRVRRQFADLFDGGLFALDDRNTLITNNRPIDIVDISDRDTGFIIQKYSNATSTGGFGVDQTFVDTDFPLFRLADVHLMYAEAHLRGGGGALNTAVDLVNDLRTRANNPNLISSAELTLDFVLDERSRELHWEAHRRQDLIRYNRYTGGNYNWAWKGNGSNGISIPSNFNIFPIPSLSLSSNPNLTQNPGY
ncbi:MAG: RagB/SusD family nutrient uptake outer membrane protein [Winogradskyella sp.]|uniref:RagB/SusD family nutrient uptake outer membrane protein n=1 Tax=Winogradskyella sp. TaxID=1883156 RepID=UPI000F3BBB3B|nr:RagB/SusD family nutrient uptake outer membrane protein [Winogradskyella sp.]RNC87699.1 MAG: RagB/SusD family nutrient uptake outer membrane protein [Winogradskyella sp.]